MNLKNKYTIINKDNIKPVLTFLYRNGIYWCDQKYVLNVAIRDISEELTKYKELHIIITETCFFYDFSGPVNKCITYIDFKKLMREDKLKRILG